MVWRAARWCRVDVAAAFSLQRFTPRTAEGLMKPVLSVEIAGSPDAWIVRCSGEIDAATAEDVETVLTAVAEDGCKNIVVDLTHVDFIDSTGIGVLLRVHRMVEGSGHRVSVHGCSPAAQRLFEITRLDRLLEIS